MQTNSLHTNWYLKFRLIFKFKMANEFNSSVRECEKYILDRRYSNITTSIAIIASRRARAQATKLHYTVLSLYREIYENSSIERLKYVYEVNVPSIKCLGMQIMIVYKIVSVIVTLSSHFSSPQQQQQQQLYVLRNFHFISNSTWIIKLNRVSNHFILKLYIMIIVVVCNMRV